MSITRAFFYYCLLVMYTFLYNTLYEVLYYIEPLYIKIFTKNTKNSFELYDKIKDYYAHCYLLILRLVGVKIYINGDITDNRVLWVSNHRSKMDGLVIQSVLTAGGNNVVSVVKKSVSKIPIFGSFGEHSKCIFIDRTKILAEKILSFYSKKSCHDNTSILIFPEGSTMSYNSKKSSDNYSKKNNLPTYKNLLLPRTTGYQIIKAKGKFDKVGDITIRYANPEIPRYDNHSYVQLFKLFPKTIYLDITYNDIDTTNLIVDFGKKDNYLQEKINESNYKLNTNYVPFYFVQNILIFIIFYLSFFWFPVIRYTIIGIMIWSSVRMYFSKKFDSN